MHSFLTEAQQARQREFREFVATHVASAAAEWDRAEKISPGHRHALVRALAISAAIFR